MEQKELIKIIKEHEKRLRTNGKEGQRANLSYTDLSSADLHHADLRSAVLHHADLSYADLSYADLSYANLRDADLSHANLSYADLSSADLHHANLRDAVLHHANLRDADLSSADLYHANLRDADLSFADLDYSSFPLWCGGLDVNIDDRQATQLLYHLIRNVNYSKNCSESMKRLLNVDSLVKQANKFHRIDECGILKEETEKLKEM